jgi:phenylpropionate dioxygenase-like ring-hydroxylating dioxygenase large terminal subunit
LSQEVGEEVSQVTAEHENLAKSFEALPSSRTASPGELASVRSNLRDNTLQLSKSLKKSPKVNTNHKRIASERTALLRTLSSAVKELDSKHSVTSLLQFIDDNEENERDIQETVQREKQLASDISSLRQLLSSEKSEHGRVVDEKKQHLTYLKSELTSFKAQQGKQQRYLERSCAGQNAARQREVEGIVSALENEAQQLRDTIENEQMVHEERVAFLKRKTELLQQEVIEVSSKHDEDVAARDKEHDHLHNCLASEKSRMQELEESVQQELESKEARDAEVTKRQQRPPPEPTEVTIRAATMIQALWRGYKTRRQQGLIKPAKKGLAEKKKKKKKSSSKSR